MLGSCTDEKIEIYFEMIRSKVLVEKKGKVEMAPHKATAYV
jgi:hypothetical protein